MSVGISVMANQCSQALRLLRQMAADLQRIRELLEDQ